MGIRLGSIRLGGIGLGVLEYTLKTMNLNILSIHFQWDEKDA